MNGARVTGVKGIRIATLTYIYIYKYTYMHTHTLSDMTELTGQVRQNTIEMKQSKQNNTTICTTLLWSQVFHFHLVMRVQFKSAHCTYK